MNQQNNIKFKIQVTRRSDGTINNTYEYNYVPFNMMKSCITKHISILHFENIGYYLSYCKKMKNAQTMERITHIVGEANRNFAYNVNFVRIIDCDLINEDSDDDE